MPITDPIYVLLVEDSKSDSAHVQRMLQDASPQLQYEFTVFPRLADAIDSLSTNRFHIALLDLNLLDIEGIPALSALRAVMPNTPIIVYSGMDDPQLRRQAAACGAFHYLIKGKESGYAIKFIIDQALAA